MAIGVMETGTLLGYWRGMTRDYYRKELKKLKAELHPYYKLVRIGFGYQSTDRRVPWVLFKAVGSSSYADMYKQFLITTSARKTNVLDK